MQWNEPNKLIGIQTEPSLNPFSNSVEECGQGEDPLIDRKELLLGFKKGPNGYSEVDLEAIARRLHIQLWKNKRHIWGAGELHPMEVAHPGVALAALGFAVESRSSLGQFQDSHGTVEVAGLYDADNRRIQVSQTLPPHIANFTLAHELGHLVCGAPSGLHRDRALDGGGTFLRAPEEREADRFAAFFLMPAKQVHAEFRNRFLSSPFQLNEDVAFAMGFQSSRSFLKQFPTRRRTALHLAVAKTFNVKHFMSMVGFFGVSAVAMARRLEELEIVSE